MRALTALIFFLSSLSIFSFDLCPMRKFNDYEFNLLERLSEKLDYTIDELCHHDRIVDIQKERRMLFDKETGVTEVHLVFTLHYDEYSCEYHYLTESLHWDSKRSYCYSTW